MRIRLALTITLVSVMAMFAMAGIAAAQEDDPLCPRIVRDVISALGTNCANLLPGEVCYGYEIVEALEIPGVTFSQPFEVPGDKLPVTEVARIVTSELNLESEPDPTWGFAMVNTLAFIGMDEDGEPITAELVYIVPGGVELEAVHEPEYDEDGNLLIGEVDGVIYLGPMQEAYLRNLFEDPVCEGAIPPFLFVQSEMNEEIDHIINEAVVRLQGTVVLEILSDGEVDFEGEDPDDLVGDTLRVLTLFGMATLNPDTASEILIPPGFYVDICLDEPQDIGLDLIDNDQPIGDCAPVGPTPLTGADLERLGLLENLPNNLLDPIDIPVIITPSGVGAPPFQFGFGNPAALALAEAACTATPPLLPAVICDALF